MDRELARRSQTGHLHLYKSSNEGNSNSNDRGHWIVVPQGDLVGASQYQALIYASGGACSLVTPGRGRTQRAGAHKDNSAGGGARTYRRRRATVRDAVGRVAIKGLVSKTRARSKYSVIRDTPVSNESNATSAAAARLNAQSGGFWVRGSLSEQSLD